MTGNMEALYEQFPELCRIPTCMPRMLRDKRVYADVLADGRLVRDDRNCATIRYYPNKYAKRYNPWVRRLSLVDGYSLVSAGVYVDYWGRYHNVRYTTHRYVRNGERYVRVWYRAATLADIAAVERSLMKAHPKHRCDTWMTYPVQDSDTGDFLAYASYKHNPEED